MPSNFAPAALTFLAKMPILPILLMAFLTLALAICVRLFFDVQKSSPRSRPVLFAWSSMPVSCPRSAAMLSARLLVDAATKHLLETLAPKFCSPVAKSTAHPTIISLTFSSVLWRALCVASSTQILSSAGLHFAWAPEEAERQEAPAPRELLKPEARGLPLIAPASAGEAELQGAPAGLASKDEPKVPAGSFLLRHGSRGPGRSASMQPWPLSPGRSGELSRATEA